MDSRNTLTSLASGLAGAVALTAVHETAKHFLPHPPRVDVIGRRAIAKGLAGIGIEPPKGQALQSAALVGDVLSNSLFYALVGIGSRKRAGLRGALLGSLAGYGAIALPGLLGLGRKPVARTRQTQVMTFGWYLLGGLIAAAAFKTIAPKR